MQGIKVFFFFFFLILILNSIFFKKKKKKIEKQPKEAEGLKERESEFQKLQQKVEKMAQVHEERKKQDAGIIEEVFSIFHFSFYYFYNELFFILFNRKKLQKKCNELESSHKAKVATYEGLLLFETN